MKVFSFPHSLFYYLNRKIIFAHEKYLNLIFFCDMSEFLHLALYNVDKFYQTSLNVG